MTYTNKERIITIKYFLKNKGLDVPKGIDSMKKNALNVIILEQDIDMEEMLPLAKGTYKKRENKNLIVKSKVETLNSRERDMFNDEIEKVVKRNINSIKINCVRNNPLVTNTLIDDIKKNLSEFIVKHKLQDKLNDIIEKRPKPKWKVMEVTYNAPYYSWRVPYDWDEKDVDVKHGEVYYKGEEVDVKQIEDGANYETTEEEIVKFVEYEDTDDESETSSVTYESEGSKI